MMDGETASSAALKFTTRSAQRRPSMSVRQPTAVVLAFAFIAGALPMVGWAVGSPGGSLLMAAAHAEAAQKNRAEQLRSPGGTPLNPLRGPTLPDRTLK